MARTPQFQHRTQTPRPASLERVQVPNIDTGIGRALASVGQGLMDVGAAVHEHRQRGLFQTAETNISQQKAHEADRLRELETMPASDADGAADKLLSDSRTAWRKVRDNAGKEGTRVRHTVDLMVDGHMSEIEERVTQIRAQAHGGLVAEKLDTSINDRARAVEADPSTFTRTDAELSFNIEHSLVDQRAQAAMRDRARSQLSIAAVRGALARDPAGLAEQLKSKNPTAAFVRALDSQTRAEALALATRKAKEDRVSGYAGKIAQAYRAGDVFQGNRALQAIETSGLAEDEKDAVRTEVRSRNELLRVERRNANADALTGVYRALATDRATAATERTIHRLYAIGAYSTDEHASALAQMDAGALRRAKADAGSSEIAKALAEGRPLDPKDEKHRAGLASIFDSATNNGEKVGSGSWRATALVLADRTRMLPDQALSWARSSIRSPNAKLAAEAAVFVGAVQLKAPDALSQLDDDTKAFAGVVNSMVESGTPADEAVSTARANLFEVRPETRDARKRAWNDAGAASFAKGSDNALSKYIDRDFDPGMFSAQPAAGDPRASRTPGSIELAPVFRDQTERYFIKTGDVALARDMAWQDVKRVFGVSQVNGSPTMMALPPERFGVKPDEVRTELGNFLKGNPQADGSTADDIVLVPDGDTLRQLGDAMSGEAIRPGWRLVTKTGDLVLDRNGVAKRFTIPGGEEISRRIREAEAAAEVRALEQIEAAKKHREVIRNLNDAALLGGAQ
ncbi:MAG TPA: hypothetical protein VGO61_06965 [Steroidobacteraceae bacterium]|jgi:hypothetical protein|nr:hypothetical protein [Steroidobacteraceae bacterium]